MKGGEVFTVGVRVRHKIFNDTIVQVIDGRPFDEDCFCGKLIAQKFNFNTLGVPHNDYIIKNFELITD